MAWFTRPLVASIAAGSLVIGVAPVAADQPGSPPRGGSIDPADIGLAPGDVLPVPATDVTDDDASLRSTRNEVTVLVEDKAGAPTVTKLRTDSARDAAHLAQVLDDRPGVVAAETTGLRALEAVNPEPLAGSQWNLAMIGAPSAWDVSRGDGVTVAVVDSGVDASHPDLAGRLLPELDLLPDVDALPEQTSHGTRVASIIAAAINGSGMAGVAPEAMIRPVTALDPAGFGDSATVAAAIIEAVDSGARVVNLSLGGPDRDPVLDAACRYAHHQGAILVAAAGNSFAYGNPVQYPAASPYVLGVAAVDSSGARSAFSNTGSSIDLAAPGEDVLGAVPTASYNHASGTSFSAPHVAGAVALVLSADPSLSAADATALVRLSAPDDASADGRDEQIGFGVLRADLAVQATAVMQATGLTRAARLRLSRLNAKPEPGQVGRTSTFKVRVKALHPDGQWRRTPIPTAVRIQFKRSGATRYVTKAVVSSGSDGVARLRMEPPASGRWRARVKQATGEWTKSRPDYLKVLP